MFTTKLVPTTFLRRALLADAVASGACGLLLALAAGALAGPSGLAEPLLRGVGLVVLPWAALVGWLGFSEAPPRNAVWLVVGLNLAWAVESLVGVALLAPAAPGTAFILAQAALVLGFAVAQAMAARRAPRPVAA